MFNTFVVTLVPFKSHSRTAIFKHLFRSRHR